jgi:hypothetical protein
MSYTINLPNGTTLGTIPDGTVDTSTTSLTLVGRNYSNYGQIMLDDLLKLLVNSANTTSPSNPNQGQLWYDSTNNLLKAYNGSGWVVVSAATSQASAYSTTVAGSFWWDSGNKQLYVYNGTSPYAVSGWVLVGPQRNGSGAVWEQLLDTSNITHDVVSIFLDGVRTAIINKDSAFTLQSAISGFGTINLGYNMNSSYTIYGTANNASYLGGIPAANYWNSTANNTGSGTLAVLNNTGIAVGYNQQLTLGLSGNNASITNVTTTGNLNLVANGTTALTVSPSGAVTLAANPTTNLGAATKQYVDNSFVNAALTGVPTAPTAPAGTANTMIATTAFVINNSGLFANMIYQLNSSLSITDTGTGFANLQIDGTSVLTATAGGVNLLNGATAVTQPQTYQSTGNSAVATTQYVNTATQWWGGSAKFVSNAVPNAGVNDIGSHDGDFWFQLSS